MLIMKYIYRNKIVLFEQCSPLYNIFCNELIKLILYSLNLLNMKWIEMTNCPKDTCSHSIKNIKI